MIVFLDLKNCIERIELKDYEIKILQHKIASLVGVESEFQRLFHEKKQQLKFRHKDIASEIILLESAIRHQTYHQTQINEALEIGVRLEELLVTLYDEIDQITLISPDQATELRSGNVGSNLSYGNQKGAKKLALDLQSIDQLCMSFSEELQDVNQEYSFAFISFTEKTIEFLDHFYVGFISDFIRRRGRTTTLHNIDATLAKVRKLLGHLNKEIHQSIEVEKEQKETLEKLVLGRDIY